MHSRFAGNATLAHAEPHAQPVRRLHCSRPAQALLPSLSPRAKKPAKMVSSWAGLCPQQLHHPIAVLALLCCSATVGSQTALTRQIKPWVPRDTLPPGLGPLG